MPLFSLADLETAVKLVHSVIPATPQYAWPLLAKRAGCEVWVKHENHTLVGAFKIRGGIVYLDALIRSGTKINGVITATRGNHGQSIAFAATRAGLSSVIVVPKGNSKEKNMAMETFGAELIVHGNDFDESKDFAAKLAKEHGLHFVPSFHPDLVKGVATYALEFFTAQPDLDAVYAPIGMGSGIAGLITVRDLLGLKTQIIGVVADNAPAIALSFEAGRPVPTNFARTFADGMACREPNTDAVDIITKGAARIARVSEDQIAEAMRAIYTGSHNIAEGAGAAAFAALLKEKDAMRGKRVGVILSGANIDTKQFAHVLAGETPQL